jgi:hypothetical protein
MLFTIGARGGNGGAVSQASHLGLAERVKEDDEDVEDEVEVDGMNEIRAKKNGNGGDEKKEPGAFE